MQIEIKLLELMAKNNIRTIADLHERTGISRTTISLILDGKKKSLFFSTMATLCEVLNCDLHELLVVREEKK
jgi:putative transcriptional regulator